MTPSYWFLFIYKYTKLQTFFSLAWRFGFGRRPKPLAAKPWQKKTFGTEHYDLPFQLSFNPFIGLWWKPEWKQSDRTSSTVISWTTGKPSAKYNLRNVRICMGKNVLICFFHNCGTHAHCAKAQKLRKLYWFPPKKTALEHASGIIMIHSCAC